MAGAVDARVIDRNGQQFVVFPDGTEVPMASVQSAMTQQADYMLPPRADAAIAPTVPTAGSSYQFGDVGRDAGNEALQAAYAQLADAVNPQSRNLLDVATNYATGTAGGLLSGAIGLGQKAGGYAADVLGAGAEALGSDRWSRGGAAQAIYGDMGAGSQAAGLGTEANALGLLSELGAGKYARGAIADRLNQAGPVPTMYGNPIAGLISDVKDADPAHIRGAEVMDMLKSGRGSDVTDQMLDMGDPVLNARLNEYLYKNADIPMDASSRMARADEMGFQKTFHGTGSNINAVDPAYFGSGGKDLLGAGFYTSTNTGRADRYIPRERSPSIEISKNYAEGGNILPVMVREQNPFILEDPLGSAANDIANLYAEDPFFDVNRMSSGVNIVTDADGKSIMLDPYQQRHFALQRMRKDFSPTDASNTLSELGYTGVSGPESASSRVRVSYNPSDVRSRFARFDPRLSHLKNLSASVGAGLLGAGMMSDGGNQQ
jgi:hypothetical protein